MNRVRQVGAMMNSREIGLTLLGGSGGLNYRFGMYNGTGRSRENDNRFLYTSRLGYTFDLPGDASELITIGWNHQATRLISFAVNGLARFSEDADDQFGLSRTMQFQF